MPCCPSCAKGFKDAASVAMHMSQPASGCNNWVNDLVRLREVLDLPSITSGARNLSLSPHSSNVPTAEASHGDSDAMDLDYEAHGPASVPNKLTEDHFPGAAQTFGKGQTFFDKFNADKFCNHRRENLYYPFASRLEWQLALWLLRSGVSMAATDAFLSLKIVSFPLNFSVTPIVHRVLSRSKSCISHLTLQRNYVDVPSYYQADLAGNLCKSKPLIQQSPPCICIGVILWIVSHRS